MGMNKPYNLNQEREKTMKDRKKIKANRATIDRAFKDGTLLVRCTSEVLYGTRKIGGIETRFRFAALPSPGISGRNASRYIRPVSRRWFDYLKVSGNGKSGRFIRLAYSDDGDEIWIEYKYKILEMKGE